ncbi:Ig-like domain repeat protein [Streptomyces sp. CoH27]|uniref:Ig-like domain repeat protein n=1 Tax=Streptomyces sp. CoH27 TaxID=2875763 RepID=UPI001CD3DAB2|nr:Ig-like domain repeat protein [Streptomyces sp. CoH27]
MRKRSLTAVTALAVLIGSAALAAPSAFADSSSVLPVKKTGDLVVDGAHQQVFISDPANGTIVVTDYTGKVLKELPSLPGVTGLELSADSGTLYAAVRDANQIAVIDTATDTPGTPFTVGDRPVSVAVAGGRLWFGYGSTGNGDIGSVDLVGEQHQVTLDQARGWYGGPILDAAPGSTTLLAGEPGLSPSTVTSYDVSMGTPTRLASAEVGSNLRDLAVTPDGKDVITASGAPYKHPVFKTADMTPDGGYASATYPNAVAIAPDGTVAAGVDGWYNPDIFVYKPGGTTPLRTYDFPNTGSTSGADELADSALAWAPDSSRLFAVSYNSNGVYSLRVFTSPAKAATALTVDAPATAARAKQLTVTGKVISSVPLPTGTQLTVTRTDVESPKGKALTPVAVRADGTFSFTDTPPAGGKVTYTVSYAGDADHAAASASDSVSVSRATTALTLNNNRTVYDYGKAVKFTAHLGTTYTNRTVEIWADPYGSDRPNKLVKSGRVDSHGNLSVTLNLWRDTTVTAKFAGDARYQPASARSIVGDRVSISTSVGNQYKSAYVWGQTYSYFHTNKNPLITTRMTYYPGRAQKFEFQVYYQGTWYPGDPAYFKLGSDGVSRVQITGDHSKDVGWRFRIRSSYIDGSSGDIVNSTTNGPWKYFTFTR